MAVPQGGGGTVDAGDLFSMPGADDGLQAWLIDGEGRVHPSIVETDGEWNGLSRIAKGLSAGDRIVGIGAFKLKDGDQVRVVER